MAIIIRCDCDMSKEDLIKLHTQIAAQYMNTGVILLPFYCSLLEDRGADNG